MKGPGEKPRTAIKQRGLNPREGQSTPLKLVAVVAGKGTRTTDMEL